MRNIWRERVRKLRAWRTGALHRSVLRNMKRHDREYTELDYSFRFNAYGIYVDAGTGRGVWRGNPGDIGRDNKRRRRPWMNPKYYMSVCNIRDFMAENLGREFVKIVDTVASGPGNPFDYRAHMNRGIVPIANLPD